MIEAERRIRGAMARREATSGWATVTVPDLTALLAELDRLTRENKQLAEFVEAVGGFWGHTKSVLVGPESLAVAIDGMAEENLRLTRERDEAAKDAARYVVLTGWLARHGLLQRIPEATRPDGTFGVTWVLHPPKVIDGSRLEGWSATTAACAIDSALAQIEQERSEQAKDAEARG